MIVAIQGILGSYSEEAANLLLKDKFSILECDSFQSVFSALIEERADFAVIPVWNKVIGKITQNVAAINEFGFTKLNSLELPIHHVLVGTIDSTFEQLEIVTSQPEAIRQCERFFLQNPQLSIRAGKDTAMSVKQVVEQGDSRIAAIGSERAAALYGGKILKENLSDNSENSTLFYLIRKGRQIC